MPMSSGDHDAQKNNNNGNGNSNALSEGACVIEDGKLEPRGSLATAAVSSKRPNFSVRMTRRSALFAERKQLSDYALVFGVSGILLMVIETELTMAHVYEKASNY